MAKLPSTFEEALKDGYRIEAETSTDGKGDKRLGVVRLVNGTRPRLAVAYVADQTGYRFSKPAVAGKPEASQ